jgi:ATP-binding cassette subfamily B protein
VLATIAPWSRSDWRLAVFSLALLPFFVWLTGASAASASASPPSARAGWPTCRSLVEESLSVSGILLGKTMGRSDELAARFEAESAQLADLEVALADGRPLADGLRADVLRGDAGARLPLRRPQHGRRLAAISIGTLVAFTTLQTRLLLPAAVAARRGIDVQTSLALFGRIFEYLDLPVDIAERAGAARWTAGRPRRGRLRGRRFGYDADAPRRSTASTSSSRRARRWRSWARRARARRRSATSSRGCTTSTPGA